MSITTRQIYKSYIYKVTVAPVNLPISLALLKEHLKLDSSDTSQDDYLTIIIKAVAGYCEDYTRRTLINTTYETYRDDFSSECMQLRRSPLSSLTKIEYLVSDVLTTVSSATYYITDSQSYPVIYIKENEVFPTDIDDRKQSVVITFVAGYGADDTSIPDDLKIALLNHAAKMYENRGDCSEDVVSGNGFVKSYIPGETKIIYDMYKIRSIYGQMCI